MSERKPCLRCGRTIDGHAKLCPYCNWDQADFAPPRDAEAVAAPAADYTPPDETRKLKRRLLYGAGGLVLLIVCFYVGLAINRDGAPKVPAGEEAQATATVASTAKPLPTANVTLVPVSGADAEIEAPITSAPVTNSAEGMPTEYQRHDATAVSSEEYAQLAARAKAERERMAALVDPRSLAGRAYAAAGTAPPAAARRAPQPAAQPLPPGSALPPPMMSQAPGDVPAPAPEPPRQPEHKRISLRTRPVPVAQPLPDIHVYQTATARLELIVGADGRVKEVTIRQGIGRDTGQLVRSLHGWRFKPATENGIPVSAPYTVDISFNADE